MDIVKAYSTEEVNIQLQRILESAPFRTSPTLTRFLAFIVSETIRDNEQQIKEYSIAVHVLNRPPDFNPHDDAVVRIHAGRLRRALNEYYLIYGINDPIVIHIPKGHYIPHFEVAETGTGLREPTTDQLVNGTRPVVAVFPFCSLPNSYEMEHFSWILRTQLSAELARSGKFSIIGHYSKEMSAMIEQNILEAGKNVGAAYILVGSLQYQEEILRVSVHLINATTGELILSKSFERHVVFPGIFEMQDEIVKGVTATVEEHASIISRLNTISPCRT